MQTEGRKMGLMDSMVEKRKGQWKRKKHDEMGNEQEGKP